MLQQAAGLLHSVVRRLLFRSLVALAALLFHVFVGPLVASAAPFTAGVAQGQAARPAGLIALVVANAIFSAGIPLLNIALWLARGGWRTAPQMRGGMLIYLLISVGILIATPGVLAGANTARIALLALITIGYSFVLFGNLYLMRRPPELRPANAYPRITVVYSAIWLALNLGFFLNPATVAWYLG